MKKFPLQAGVTCPNRPILGDWPASSISFNNHLRNYGRYGIMCAFFT